MTNSRALWHLPLFALLAVIVLSGCQPNSDLLSQIKAQGELKVITRNGPTTYYEGRQGPTGFEYELAKRFADHLGVELTIETTHSLEEILHAVETNRAHIAAAGLTATPERRKRLDFSPSYMLVEELLLYHRDRPRPDSPNELRRDNFYVIANSSHLESLNKLSAANPDLSWYETSDLETFDLLEKLKYGEIDHMVIDSNEYTINRALYPRLRIAFTLGDPGALAWALQKSPRNATLLKELQTFFAQLKESGELDELIDRFYSHNETKTQVNAQTFQRAVETRLPRYRELIETIAAEYDMHWALLAAISYQESHWNPRARSPTGVRGMMMLTLNTAGEVGVTNRLDAEQSLRGGAAYLQSIHRRFPDRIQEPDRMWFALAAYNVGKGHLEDARIITERQGGDPDRWSDVKERLPLLQKRSVYRHTRYGYARGSEPVHYVQNIRHYYDLLMWEELSEQRTPPPTNMDQYLPDSVRSSLDAL